MKITERFEQALIYAIHIHSRQLRKGTHIPYASHLLGVTALVMEHGGDEDQAIAALLHDAVEDQGGLPRLNEIRDLFGERVASIVDGCTDTYNFPKSPWLQRKEQYLSRLPTLPDEVRLVSLADKVHNARSLLASLYKEGAAAWSRFNGGKEGTLWYYRRLVEVFQQTGQDFLTGELIRLVSDIEEYAGR